MYLPYIRQCTIQNRNVHISGLSDVFWDAEQLNCGICEIGILNICASACESVLKNTGRKFTQVHKEL